MQPRFLSSALGMLAVAALLGLACSPDAPPVAASTPVVPIASAAEASSTPAATPDARGAAPSEPVGALLLDWDSGEATPLHPTTLEVVPGSVDIDGWVASVSPDGRWVITRTQQVITGARVIPGDLVIYERATWREAARLDQFEGYPGQWAPDSDAFYAWFDHCGSPAAEGVCLGEWDRGVARVGLDGRVERLATFDFSATTRAIAPDGAYAYALALRTDICCGIGAESDPFLARIDLATGEVTAELALPDLYVGQPRHWLGVEGTYARYHPEIAISPDGERLYLVHSEEDVVTVVDLARMAVEETRSFAERPSALGRFGSWLRSQFVSVAHAKGGPAYYRQAALTEDGRHLLVSGTTVRGTPETVEAGEPWESRPAGLTVLDLETLEVVFRDPDIATFEVSADGGRLIGYGSWHPAEPPDDPRASNRALGDGLLVLDLATFEVAHHLWPGEALRAASLSADGRYAYARSDGPGMDQWYIDNTNCTADCERVRVVDLATGAVVTDRTLGRGHGLHVLTPQRP
ncbi:MAG: hypothetical protein WD058_03795 [Dehalococcoidia bacterium]